jgi:hypothetical protein
MMAGIDEIRTDLERRNATSVTGQPCHQRQGEGGFTASAVDAGNYESIGLHSVILFL